MTSLASMSSKEELMTGKTMTKKADGKSSLHIYRKVGEKVIIGDNIEVIVLRASGSVARLLFRAPESVKIRRVEMEDKPQSREEKP